MASLARLLSDAAVLGISLVTISVLLSQCVDREPGLQDILSDQAAELSEHSIASYYLEDYSSSEFIDFRRQSRIHPFLIEYASELETCTPDEAVSISYQVAVDAAGRRLHTVVEAQEPEGACLQRAFTHIPFEALAPPTGILVISGRVTSEDFQHHRSPASGLGNKRELNLEHHWITYADTKEDELILFSNSEDGSLRDAQLEAINDRLRCPSPYQTTRLTAHLQHPGTVHSLETAPHTPCVEAALRKHWKMLPGLLSDDASETPEHLLIRFSVLLDAPEQP